MRIGMAKVGRKPIYNSEHATLWRRLMKENKWKQWELAEHLEISKQVVQRILEKDAYGELR